MSKITKSFFLLGKFENTHVVYYLLFLAFLLPFDCHHHSILIPFEILFTKRCRHKLQYKKVILAPPKFLQLHCDIIMLIAGSVLLDYLIILNNWGEGRVGQD